MLFEQSGELPPRESRSPVPDDWDKYVEATKHWLKQHWGERHCPYCDHDVWRINPVVSLVNTPDWPLPEGMSAGLYPAVPIICAKCGHIVLINALYIFRMSRDD
jgi:hypothetical protein